MTQKELAAFFKRKDTTISGWENGYDDMPLESLILFCNHFNYNIDYVLGLSSTNNKTFEYILNTKSLGNNLKKIHTFNKLSQHQIAQKLTISQSCYSQYETGRNVPTISFLHSFSISFNVSIQNLINERAE